MSESIVYKFVELSVVTDESIEEAVNEWVSQGWQLERIEFVTGPSSRRPSMAFIAFVRSRTDGDNSNNGESGAADCDRE